MEIRPAQRPELPELIHLWEQLMIDGETADPSYRRAPEATDRMRHYMSSWFEDPSFTRCLVADSVGLVGFIQGAPVAPLGILDLPPTARIGDLWVSPAHRRQGLGRKLVEAFVERATAAGFLRTEVGTLVRDERAVAFWRSLGFVDRNVILARDPYACG